MASFNKFNTFAKDSFEKVHNLSADTLKVMLTNTAPVATNAVKADLTDIGAGNGYTAGGSAATISSSTQSSGTYKLVLADVTWTASGGSIGPFRYAALYNSTAASSQLIGWWDYGSAVTLAAGESFTWDADPTTGIIQCT